MKNSVVIVAAGQGKRMRPVDSKLKKQYLPLADKPVLIHTLEIFEKLKDVCEIIVVLPKKEVNYFKQYWLKKYKFLKVKKIIVGGQRRQSSVFEGLKNVSKECDLVIIHDGVRPLIEKKIIIRAIKEANKYGASIVGVPVKETIKEIDNGFIKRTLKRENIYSIQTPQIFRYALIKEVYLKAEKKGLFTNDDAELVEILSKQKIKLVLGNYENLKITTPEDLLVAEEILKRK